MNIYVIDVGVQCYTDVIDSELGGPQMEDRFIDQVVARTPGHAKKIYADWLKYNWGISLEWTDKCWRVYTVQRNVRKY